MTYDIFLSYAHADKARVERIAFRLESYGLRVWFDKWHIVPGDNFHAKINDGLEQSEVTIVVYSKASTDSEWVKSETAAAFDAAVKRTGQEGKRLIPLKLEECKIPPLERALDLVDLSQIAPDDVAGWESGVLNLLRAFKPGLVKLREGHLSLPLVIASMTAKEAATLFTGEAFAGYPAHWKKSFDRLREELGRSLDVVGLPPGTEVEKAVLGRYAERREDWCPFSSVPTTVRQFVEALVGQLNDAQRQQVQKTDPDISLEFHSHALFADQPEIRNDTAYRLAQRGCLLIIDPLALFHPQVVESLNASQLLLNPTVTIICTSPLDLSASAVAAAVGTQFQASLGPLLQRFKELEPQCVMGVNDPLTLGLWLKLQLPIAASRLNKTLPIKKTLDIFTKSTGVAVYGIDAAITESIQP